MPIRQPAGPLEIAPEGLGAVGVGLHGEAARIGPGAVQAQCEPSRAGEQVEVHWPEPRPLETQPQEMPLDILYEDEVLLVLNKAAGVVVHPAAGTPSGTQCRQGW